MDNVPALPAALRATPEVNGADTRGQRQLDVLENLYRSESLYYFRPCSQHGTGTTGNDPQNRAQHFPNKFVQ